VQNVPEYGPQHADGPGAGSVTAETQAAHASASDRGLSVLADEDLKLALLIRHFEQKLLDLFAQGQLNGTTHTCLGQEYIPVALRPLLNPEDFIFSNHRGHGHYLARHGEPHGLLAEIMGRAGAVCSGLGGSQHILRNNYLSTGVQGESLPVATGMALALKHSSPGHLACAYVGDGTWGEGAVYEALNMAQLWRVPLVVVVENNGIAQSTPTELQMAGTIEGRCHGFGIRYERVDSVDINDIRYQLKPGLQSVRTFVHPLVIEFRTSRLGPHSKGDDTRPAEAVEDARKRDWCQRYAVEFPGQFRRCDDEMRARIDHVAEEVAALPLVSMEGS
jgi:acetoin:2,6-dichlorophenolindophenol oxidoreductase subunit alpha